VRRRVVRRLARRGARGATVEAGHVEAVLRLLARPGGGRAALPGAEARIEAGRLSIGAARPPPAEVAPVAVGGPGRYAVPELGLAVEVASAVAAPVDWPLLLRTRRPGDRFRPAGGRGSKKLKAWLIDRKVARARRDSLVLLVDRAGAVLAIPELGAVAAGWTGRLDVRVETAR
jgi:tRNA(Ile)-lysidine synthase